MRQTTGLAGKLSIFALLVAVGVLALGPIPSRTVRAEGQAPAIDWNYARQLLEKSRSGQTLTPEEQAYLDRAKEERRKGAGVQPPGPMPPPRASTGLAPLDQMTAQDKYKGEDGGLYGEGRNVPPPAHQEAARKELAKVAPLDDSGRTAPGGKIALVSIGMSNTTQEFSKFKELAERDSAKSPSLVIVDGAQGGQDAIRWAEDGDTSPWRVLDRRLQAASVTAPQVQVAWVKHARIRPSAYGDFPKHAEELQGHLLSSLVIAKKRFPNLRVAYLSSRLYAGYATTPLNPEPYAYESAFAVRRLILDQVKGDPRMNWNPAKGEVKVPLLLWGPYLWADGTTPRQSDGLIWNREDLAGDGTHPSPTSGREKVGGLLLKFFKGDPNARGWFVSPQGGVQAVPSR